MKSKIETRSIESLKNNANLACVNLWLSFFNTSLYKLAPTSWFNFYLFLIKPKNMAIILGLGDVFNVFYDLKDSKTRQHVRDMINYFNALYINAVDNGSINYETLKLYDNTFNVFDDVDYFTKAITILTNAVFIGDEIFDMDPFEATLLLTESVLFPIYLYTDFIDVKLDGFYGQGQVITSGNGYLPALELIASVSRGVYGYYASNPKSYDELNGSSLVDIFIYISNVLLTLDVNEKLSLDIDDTYLCSYFKKCIDKNKSMYIIDAEIDSDYVDLSGIFTVKNNVFYDVLGKTLSVQYGYANKIVSEITNVILEYLPSIQADIAYIRTTYPDIPDVETAKSLEKILYSNVGVINEDVNQTRDDVSLASGTTSQQVVQRILTGTAWASAYKQYINPVKYTEIADAIKRRIFKEIL